MPRYSSVVGFVASFSLVVAARWSPTVADIPTDGALTRPAQQTLHVGDAEVMLQLDRGIQRAGDALEVSLVGTAPRAHDVSVDVTALEDMGMSGERVEQPPRVVGRRTVKVHAAPEGGDATIVRFTLGRRHARPGHAEWFDVLATPARARKPRDVAWEEQEAGRAAVAGVVTWTGNAFDLAIEPPAELPATGACQVAVRVKNTTRRPIANLMVELGAGPPQWNELDAGLSLGSTDDVEITWLDEAAPDDVPLEPGAERVFTFQVRSSAPGRIVLTAQATADGGGALDVRAVGGAAPRVALP